MTTTKQHARGAMAAIAALAQVTIPIRTAFSDSANRCVRNYHSRRAPGAGRHTQDGFKKYTAEDVSTAVRWYKLHIARGFGAKQICDCSDTTASLREVAQ